MYRAPHTDEVKKLIVDLQNARTVIDKALKTEQSSGRKLWPSIALDDCYWKAHISCTNLQTASANFETGKSGGKTYPIS